MAVALPSSRRTPAETGSLTDGSRDSVPVERLILLVEQLRELAAGLEERCARLDLRLDEQGQVLHRIEGQLGQQQAGRPEPSPVGNDAPDPQADCGSGLETLRFLRKWQDQRDEMLERMTQQTGPDSSGSRPELTAEETTDPAQALLNASAEDLDEIQRLKDQLQQAMKDAEIELSRERARLSHERLNLEKMESEWRAREQNLLKELAALKGPKQRDGGLFRLRRFLGGRS